MKRTFNSLEPASNNPTSHENEPLAEEGEDVALDVASPSSNNDKMHPRNPYKNKRPNFKELSEKYPPLVPFLNEFSLDFRSSEAQRALTTALLDNDFGIKVALPTDQLCPTVTSRVNYILWLEDLLALGTPKVDGVPQIPKGPHVRGIDIGVGASCIYPLLGRSMDQWRFLGTDIDPISLEWAQKNISSNGWDSDIELRRATAGTILNGVLKDGETFAFCMCNPPFFESVDDKVPNPNTALEATSSELATLGGEAAFIGQIIDDSLVLRDRIKWYTSMIGRKVTLKKIQQRLRDAKIPNVRTTTFYQGNTTRWAIAWSFGSDGLVEAIREKTLELFRGKSEVTLRSKSARVGEAISSFESSCRNVELKFTKDPARASYSCKLYDNAAWLRTVGRIPSTLASMVGTGPFIPPTLLVALSVDFAQLSLNSPINFIIKYSGGDLDLFAELCVALKERHKT